MKNDKSYIFLFAVLMVFLLLPSAQKEFGVFKIKKLKNDDTYDLVPKLTLNNYKSGTFQAQSEKYLASHYGFREFTLRLYNQYLYTFYKKTKKDFFMPGKDGWMYYRPGVLNYYGQDAKTYYSSNDEAITKWEEEISRMNELRSILKNDYGIEFLSFMAPDKAYIYPEHLPDMEMDTTVVKPADYFTKRLKEIGFPNINMTPWFQKIKDTTTMELFKPMDSHWEYMGAVGYDSLFHFMDSLNNFGIPKTRIERITKTVTKERQDDEQTLNLLFRTWRHTNSYKAEVSVTCDSTTRKPKVLFVGDSFIFAFEYHYPFKKVLGGKEIWFYYDLVWAGIEKETRNIKKINKLKSVLNADFVVFYSVGHSWWKGTDKFATDILADIKDPEKVKLALTMIEIENKPWMMQDIRKKAKEKGITEQEMLELDAKWIIKHENR